MNAPGSITAIITNYNSQGTVLKALQSLLEQDAPPACIIVVDNGSTDDGEQIRRAFPQARLIQLAENTGLTHARNMGLAQADTDLVLFLDDDVYLAPDCLSRMTATATERQAVAVCPRIVLYPENSTIQCDGASIHFAGMLMLDRTGKSTTTTLLEPHAVGGFIGACILMQRQLLVDLGGFDEDYFFYFEDMELSYRLRALGHSIWCEPRAVAQHDRGQGTPGLSFRGQGAYPRLRAYYTLRHSWLTVLLHYELKTLIVLAPAFGLLKLASLVQAVMRGWWREWFRAAGSLLSEVPSIIKRRRKWQRARRVPDHEILAGGPLPLAPGFVGDEASRRAAHALSRLLDRYWTAISSWL